MKKILNFTLAFLLITQQAFAAVNWLSYGYFSNTGGLNNGFTDTAIADNEASDLQNIVFSTYGSFGTRDGSAKVNTATLGSSVICTGLYFYKPISGSKYLVGVFDNDKIYKMDWNTGTGLDGTWDDITGALSFAITQTNLASFTVGEDTLIFDDGLNTTAPYKWDGSGNAEALGGSPPNATMVMFHKNMAFAAGNNTYPSTLYFSDVGNIENWTTGLAGNISIETNDGSIIRAILPGFDALYIFKDYSIWRLSGADKDTFQLQKMVSGTGCRSPTGVRRIGNDFFFTDGQGNTYLYDGAIKLEHLSTKVQGTIDDANFSRWIYVATEVFDDDLYVSFPLAGETSNSVILMFDSFNLAWTKFKGMNAHAMCVAEDGNGKELLIFGAYNGFVYKYPSGTDDAGTAIDAYYVTKQYRFPELKPYKNWKLLNVYAVEAGDWSLTVESRKDFETTGSTKNLSLYGDTSAVWDSAVYDVDTYSTTNAIIGRVEVNKDGQFFQVKFSNSNIDEYWEVKGFQFWLEETDKI